jgi:hypothetical protein
MIKFNNKLYILFMSLFLVLVSCDPTGGVSTQSSVPSSSSLDFVNIGVTGFWILSPSSCGSPCRKDFYFRVEKSDSYRIYSTGNSDTFGAIYEYENNEYNYLRGDFDSGSGKNFSISVSLYSSRFYRLSVSVSGGIKELSNGYRHVYVWLN